MKAEKEVTVGGHTYKCGMLPVKEARPLLVKLANLLGPALGELMVSGESTDLKNVGSAFARLTIGLKDEDLLHIQNSLFTHSHWMNETGHWVPLRGIADNHFAGAFGAMFKVMFAALEHNYGDFLGDLGLKGILPTSPASETPAE